MATNQRTLMAVLKLKDDMSNGLKKVAGNIKKITSQLENAQSKFDGLGQNIESITKPVSNLNSAIAGIGVGATIGATLKNYDQSLVNLQNQFGLSKNEAEKFRSEMQTLASQGYDLNASLQSLGQIKRVFPNLTGGELNNAVKDIQILSQTFGVESHEITNATQQMVQHFGIEVEKAMDIIGMGFQHGLDYGGEWLDTMREYSVQFADLGLTAEETFTILKNGFDEGVFSIDKLADGIKEFNIRISEIDEDSGEALNALGFDIAQVQKAMDSGGATAKAMSMQIVNAISKIEREEARNAVALTLFGTMYEDVQDVMLNSFRSILDGVEEVTDITGEMQKVYEESFGARMQGLIARFVPTLERIGLALMPILEKVADLAEKFADWLDSIPQEQLEFFVSLGVTVMGITGAFTVLAGVINSVSTVLGAINGVIGLVTSSTGLLSGVITLLSNPIFLVIGGIIALISVLYKVSPAFQNVFDKAFNIVKETVENIIKVLSPFVQEVVDNFNKIKEKAIQVFEGILDNVLSIVKTLSDNCVASLSNLVNNLLNIFKNLKNSIISFFSNMFTNLEQMIWNFNDRANEIAKNFAVNLVQTIQTFIQSMPQIIQSVIQSIINIVSQLPSMIINMWNNIVQATKEAWQNIKNAIAHSVDGSGEIIVNKFKTAFGNVLTAWDNLRATLSKPINTVVNIAQNTINSVFGKNEKGKRSAFGTRRVIGNDVPYRLHDGEMVLPAWEARNYRENNYNNKSAKETQTNDKKTTSIGNININISNMQVREEADINKIAETILKEIMERKGVVV